MQSRRQRPLRPARSLDDFRVLFTYNARMRDGSRDYVDARNWWPCIICASGGRVRDPADRDPVEGYKLAPWYKCEACQGKGQTCKETFKAFYDEEVRKYKVALADYREGYKHWRKALSKLNRQERQALQSFGIPTRKRRGVNIWTI